MSTAWTGSYVTHGTTSHTVWRRPSAIWGRKVVTHLAATRSGEWHWCQRPRHLTTSIAHTLYSHTASTQTRAQLPQTIPNHTHVHQKNVRVYVPPITINYPKKPQNVPVAQLKRFPETRTCMGRIQSLQPVTVTRAKYTLLYLAEFLRYVMVNTQVDSQFTWSRFSA